MGYKRNVKEGIKRLLYASSGNMCAMYGCVNQLVYANTANISEICHIEAVNEDGARYNPNLTEEYVNSYDNLVLLCPTCHVTVDNKLNEGFYTVEYLKRMKELHERKVNDALLSSPVIAPPIYWDSFDVNEIIEKYSELFDKEIDSQYVYKILDLVFSMQVAVRSVVYGIAILCKQDMSEQVDIHRLQKMMSIDLYSYAEILMLLEQQKLIEETRFVHPMDGYEDENGDFHFVQNDYLYKATQGTWCLRKRGRLFWAICSLFNDRDFYDFMVNKNIELLRNLDQWEIIDMLPRANKDI